MGVVIAATGVGVGIYLGRRNPSLAPTAGAASAAAPAPTEAPSVPGFTMNGVFLVAVENSTLADGAHCRVDGLDADISDTTPVTVFDDAGHRLTGGYLEPGVFVSNPLGKECKWGFSIVAVPDGPAKYSVEVGTHGGQPVSSATAHTWVVLNG
ncbi:hypothetical protein [Amycolatopsis sp.]|uniref:hypothetical protein n=1 Tax=Amycolatopsis sp. TaxID=37632 RepID=UPI00262649B5|nr:hypothetical protein [Amycolatopsis sp.]